MYLADANLRCCHLDLIRMEYTRSPLFDRNRSITMLRSAGPIIRPTAPIHIPTQILNTQHSTLKIMLTAQPLTSIPRQATRRIIPNPNIIIIPDNDMAVGVALHEWDAQRLHVKGNGVVGDVRAVAVAQAAVVAGGGGVGTVDGEAGAAGAGGSVSPCGWGGMVRVGYWGDISASGGRWRGGGTGKRTSLRLECNCRSRRPEFGRV